MNKIALSCLVVAITCSSMSGLAATGNSDKTTIVSFSRHTFRGTTKNIGPQKIDLQDFGINITAPNLSYEKDATTRGLEIARKHASAGLQKAAAQGVKALGETKSFDGRWDEIRADLATERTFWTALKLRDGLKANFPTQNVNLFVSGCRTKPGKGIDIISTDHAITQCTPKELSRPLHAASPDLPILKAQAETFLAVVCSAIGEKGPSPKLPTPEYSKNEKLSSSYTKTFSLASNIEMIAEIGPPLKELFKVNPTAPLLTNGKAALTEALKTLGVRFFVEAPTPMPEIATLHPVNYMMSLPKGSHTIVLTHDGFISKILRSLSLISTAGDLDETAIYPIENIIFAFGDSHVSVTRMRIHVNSNGFIPGPFDSKVIWKGTRAQWDEKVRALNDRAKAWDLGSKGNECLKAITICKAEIIETLY